MARETRDTPWLDRRDNGTFYAFWYDKERQRTERMSLGTKEPSEAQIAFGHFLLNGKDVYEDHKAESYTVAQCLDHYWREHVLKKCVDSKRQKDAIRHLKKFFGTTNLVDIDIPKSRDYVEARRTGVVGGGKRRKDKTGSNGTICRELTVLLAAANHAAAWKRISKADVPVIEKPEVEPKQVLWLTRAELAAAFKLSGELENRYLHHFMRIAYFTAGRKNAVQSLTIQQVDIENGVINLGLPGTKQTKKRKAIVPLYDEIKPDIAWLARHAEGDRLFGYKDFYRPFRTFMTSIGYGDKAHPHVLRHTRATHLLQRGVDIFAVAKLLGDTVATVERVYGHHSPDYLEETTGGL